MKLITPGINTRNKCCKGLEVLVFHPGSLVPNVPQDVRATSR